MSPRVLPSRLNSARAGVRTSGRVSAGRDGRGRRGRSAGLRRRACGTSGKVWVCSCDLAAPASPVAVVSHDCRRGGPVADGNERRRWFAGETITESGTQLRGRPVSSWGRAVGRTGRTCSTWSTVMVLRQQTFSPSPAPRLESYRLSGRAEASTSSRRERLDHCLAALTTIHQWISR